MFNKITWSLIISTFSVIIRTYFLSISGTEGFKYGNSNFVFFHVMISLHGAFNFLKDTARFLLIYLQEEFEFFFFLKLLRNNGVYQIICPRCNSSYVGQTALQLQRFKEHIGIKGPMKTHFENYNITPTNDIISNVDLARQNRWSPFDLRTRYLIY